MYAYYIILLCSMLLVSLFDACLDILLIVCLIMWRLSFSEYILILFHLRCFILFPPIFFLDPFFCLQMFHVSMFSPSKMHQPNMLRHAPRCCQVTEDSKRKSLARRRRLLFGHADARHGRAFLAAVIWTCRLVQKERDLWKKVEKLYRDITLQELQSSDLFNLFSTFFEGQSKSTVFFFCKSTI